MTPLQFSLFFVALVGMYVLVHLRLVKLEAHLRELSRLEALQRNLERLSEAMLRPAAERWEDSVDRIRDDLGALLRAVERLHDEIQRGIVSRSVDPARSAAERIRALVETRLLDLGYRNLRFIGDLTDARLEGDFEVLVECQKQGMEHKGSVAVRNGTIHTVDFQNVAAVFP